MIDRYPLFFELRPIVSCLLIPSYFPSTSGLPSEYQLCYFVDIIRD